MAFDSKKKLDVEVMINQIYLPTELQSGTFSIRTISKQKLG